MGTAERSEAPASGAVGHPGLDGGGRESAYAESGDEELAYEESGYDEDESEREAYARRAPLWVEEPPSGAGCRIRCGRRPCGRCCSSR